MATASELRKKAVDLMVSRKGMNSYTQAGNRVYFFGKPDNKPGNTTQKGYSDCSSAVRAAIKAATGIDIGGNTSAQINNRTRKGTVVHETNGYYPDESKLLPGDCLYFKGNTSHPLDVGHVEMYIGSGKCCGHGSGIGPKVRNMRDYCTSRASSRKRYFMAIRWIPDDGSTAPDEPTGTLKKGMNDSAAVKALQQDLLMLGYSMGKYGADGDFGTSTEFALIAFQIDRGLTGSGVADAETLAAIDAAKEKLGDSEETPDFPVPIVEGVNIAPGSWNVRTGPGVEFPTAGVARGGQTLEKVELNGWIPVLFNGEVRFISPNAAKGG